MEKKEITIIKLLNEISNDKIVPKQIKYQNKIYTFNTIDKTYYDENNYDLFWDYNYLILNDTVEILPEENDEWEDIKELIYVKDPDFSSSVNVQEKIKQYFTYTYYRKWKNLKWKNKRYRRRIKYLENKIEKLER